MADTTAELLDPEWIACDSDAGPIIRQPHATNTGGPTGCFFLVAPGQSAGHSTATPVRGRAAGGIRRWFRLTHNQAR